MSVFTRHFVSQKFGRAVGTVQADDAGTGTVLITFVADGIAPARFTFDADKFSERAAHGALEELVLRTAIALLQRRAPGADTADELRPETPPWRGDLSEAPFGGATSGFARAGASMNERRNGDEQLEVSVERGVQLRLSEGRPAARFFLQCARVPPSVIRRVLSNSVARRKLPLAGAE